jgi:acetoin utilization deacetylase AcuC-like enzyme
VGNPTRRTALYRSSAFLGHDTGAHVEHPSRSQAIEAALSSSGLLTDRPLPSFGPATLEQVERVHDPRYVQALSLLADRGGGWIDSDTMCAPDSLGVALLAAGAGVAAVNDVLDGAVQTAFALGRPPGHHATNVRAMGFCLINNVAVTAAQALARGLERVAIVDWDVHHGNGTQDIFYERGDVLFCSVHHYGHFYPGTGAANERGTGAGDGFTLNAPLRAGTGDTEYLRVFDELILPKLNAYQPELILVSAGFDAHERDPLGGMRVTARGFAGMAERIVRAAQTSGHERIVAVLEGGYDLAGLSESVCAVVETLDNAFERRDE